MRIIYVSGTMGDQDFNAYVKEAHTPINPSNQNFHYRFIKALSLHTEVSAVSLRPFSAHMFNRDELSRCESFDNGVSFTYLADKAGRLYRLFRRPHLLFKELNKQIGKDDKNVLLIVDSLKYSLAKAAIRVAKKHKVPVIGVVSDNPFLLSNESKTYAQAVLSLAKQYDGFVALTTGLNELFNKQKKPSYIFHGFAEDYPPIPFDNAKPYFFACGALYERYGLVNLVDAFCKAKTDYELLIAGHGPLIPFLHEMERKDNRIHYVGLLSKDEIAKYEQNAALNINPRLFNDNLDKYSVPSKVLEYLSSGTPLLSTMHTTLHNEFCGEAIWIKDGTSQEILKALDLFIQIKTKDMKKKALLAKEKVLANYSLETQGKRIYEFLVSNNSFSTNKATRRNSK